MITLIIVIIMATNPFFSGRIPKGLDDRIEEYRKYTNESKSEVLIRALAKYVEYQLEEKAPQIPLIREEFDKIYKRLEILESQLGKKETELPKQLEITDDSEVIISDDKDEAIFLTTQEAMKKLDVSQASLSSWKNKGLLPKKHRNRKANKIFEIDMDQERSEKRKTIWRVKSLDNVR